MSQQPSSDGSGDVDVRIRACAVCARILDRSVDPDGGNERWSHPRGDTDHPAVPVLVNEVQVDVRCDFCFAANPQFEVPAEDFLIPDLPGEASLGSWTCCADCALIMERRDWDAMLARAVAAHETHHAIVMDRAARQMLRRTYRVLRAHMTGSVRPLVWPPTR